MKSKEIYQAIDLSKVGPELKTKLIALEKATDGFTNERADGNMDMAMNKIYAHLKDKKPESLKNIEVKTVEVEEKVETIVEGKPVKKTTKTKKKVAGKKKKVAKKTATPSSGLKKPTVSSVASKIRKPNESWSDALSRAKVIFNEKKQTQVAKTKKAVDDLRDFLKDDKNFTGWPRTYGKEKASDNSLERDSKRKAMPPGKRRSDTGRVYYENRDNRADREANSFPRKIFLKEGGDIMIEPTILQNNPNYLVGTETMYEMFDKGGITSRGLFKIQDEVYEKLKFESGSEIKSTSENRYKFSKAVDDALKARGVAKESLSKRIYDKLEDENAHTLNEFLILNDYFQPSVWPEGKKFYFERFKENPRSGLGKDGIVGATTKAPKGTSKGYISHDNIKLIIIKNPNSNGKKKFLQIDGSDVLNGVYDSNAFAKGGTLPKGYKYIRRADVNQVVTKKNEIIFNTKNGFWVDENALTTAETRFEAGGEVFIPTTYLDYNPDYLVGTNTMYEMFADGGMMAKGGSVDEKDSVYEIELFWKGLKRPNRVIKRFFVTEETLDEIEMRYKYDLEFDVEDEHEFEDVYDKISSFEEVEEFLKKDWEDKTNTKFAKGGEVSVYNLRKGDKVKTRKGDIETILKKNSNGNYETLENDYTHNPQSLEFISRPSRKMADGGMMAKGGKIDNYRIVPYKRLEIKGGPDLVEPDYSLAFTTKSSLSEANAMAQKYVIENKLISATLTKIHSSGNPLKNKKVSYVTKDEILKYADGGMMAKGGKIREFDDVLIISKNKLGMVEAIADNIYYVTTPFGESFEAALDDLQKVKSFAQGGAMEHKIYSGDSIKVIYDNRLIVEDSNGDIMVIDLSTEPQATRYNIQKITNENTIESAKEFIESLKIRKPVTTKGLYEILTSPSDNDLRNGLNGKTMVVSKGPKWTDKKFVSSARYSLVRGGFTISFFTDDENDSISFGELISILEQYKDSELPIIAQIPGAFPIKFVRNAGFDKLSKEFFIEVAGEYVPPKYAKGGSLQGHGFEVGDLIVEDLGGYIKVMSEDGKEYFIKLRDGDRLTEPPLPFEPGGEVKIGDIARLAAKYNKTGQEVTNAISKGADVEVEHTEDRKKAMRIAVDHLEEDFYYYTKLKAVEGEVDLTEFYEGGGNVPKVFDVPPQFLDAEGKRKNDKKTIKELTDFVLGLPQTKSIYYNDNLGGYTPSRKKLHAEIINKFKKEVVCINNDKPIAIFMGGSPASGKSSFLRKYSPFLLKEEILKIDADEIRAMLPEYEGWNACQTHLETKDIVNTLLSNKNIGIPCDFDIIYDGTMNSVKSYIPLIDILRKRGYKIFIVFMDNVPKDVIIKRALDRYKSSGRFVPLEVIEDFFSKGKSAFNELKKDVDGYMRIDGSSQDYKVLEQGGMKLPRDREYSKLGTKIKASDIPISYKKGGLSLLY